MTFDEFLGHVQHRARLGSTGAAERATRATLETLAERLAGGEAANLAAQLPAGIANYLTHNRLAAQVATRMTLDQFFARVAQREGADLPDAVFHARAVISVLQEAVTPGEMQDVRAQLPEAWDRLFTFERTAQENDEATTSR